MLTRPRASAKHDDATSDVRRYVPSVAAMASAWLYRAFLLRLPDHGVSGGAAYDTLVAATAASHGAKLMTCDRRAAPVYERYCIRVHLV